MKHNNPVDQAIRRHSNLSTSSHLKIVHYYQTLDDKYNQLTLEQQMKFDILQPHDDWDLKNAERLIDLIKRLG